MAATATVSYDLTPKGMIYSLEGKEKFVLDSADQLDLQRYVLEGQELPADNDSLKAAYNLTDDMLEDFKDLLEAFQKIQGHCNVFYHGAYTQSVNLASDVVNFNTYAKSYLKGISQTAEAFNNGRITSDYAESAVTKLISLLVEKLDEYTKKCDLVCQGIGQFLDDTRDDNVVINGSDGSSGLNKAYRDKYKLNANEITDLQTQIDEADRELDQATKEYNHDVIVAATTPTYVWVPVAGTIAAAVVAGIYGDKATKAYKKMKELRNQIRTAQDDLKKRISMSAGLVCVSKQLSELSGMIPQALSVIEGMKGNWSAMKNDLNTLLSTVQNDITQLPMCIKEMGVDAAIEQWERIAGEADDYRKRAFITETPEELAQADIILFPMPKRHTS